MVESSSWARQLAFLIRFHVNRRRPAATCQDSHSLWGPKAPTRRGEAACRSPQVFVPALLAPRSVFRSRAAGPKKPIEKEANVVCRRVRS